MIKKILIVLIILVVQGAFSQIPKTKAQLKARFDTARMTSSAVQWRNESRRNAHDGDAYWALFELESHLLAFQATGDFLYLESWLTTWYAWQDQAVPNNTFPNAFVPSFPHAYDSNPLGVNPPDVEKTISGGIFNDSFLDWDNHGLRVQAWKQGDTDGGVYPLFQGHGMRTVPKMLLVMKNNPSIRSTDNGAWAGSTYQTQYDDILAFWQNHMWNKWWTRGPSNTITRINTHMTSHWTSVGYFLNKITPNANQALAAEAFNNNVGLIGPQHGSRGFKQQVRTYTFPNGTGYVWASTWTNDTKFNDIPHAGAEMRFVVDQMMWNEGLWTETDKARFLVTAHSIINRDAAAGPWPFWISGNPAQGTTNNYWQLYYYGWPAWGRFDSSLQLKYENSRLYNDTAGGRGAHVMLLVSNLMYNRAYLEGTLVYPEFTAGNVAVTGIAFGNTTQTIREGETLNKAFTFTPTEPTNTNVTFVSSNPVIVDNNGNWVSTGTGTYTVTSQDGNFTSVINYTAATTAATGASVTPSAATIGVGNTTQLIGNVLPSTSTTKTGTWATSNGSIATVSAAGLVTGVAVGTANINFTSTDGNFVDASVITVVAASTDKIIAESPLLYLSPASIEPAVTVDGNVIAIWEDISGNNRNAIGTGINKLNVGTNRQAEFDGNSWFHIADDAAFNFNMGTANFTLIVREGDVSSLTSGYLISKVPSSLASAQYGLPYASGNLSGVFAGGTLSGFTNTPSGPNRLIIAVFTGATVNVWVDGVQVLTNGSVGTTTTTQRLNIGARTDGSYKMNAGSMIDLVAIIPSALSTLEREGIEDDFIINTVELPVVKPKRFRIGEGRAKTFYINSVKKFFNN